MIPPTRSRRIMQERCGKVTASFRKASDIAGTWKQYSGQKFFGFFPVDPCQIPVLSGRNQAKSIGKNPKIFRPEYCFHKITGTGRFRAGLFDLRMMKTDIDECHDRYLDKEKRKRGMKHDWPFFIATLIILVNSL